MELKITEISRTVSNCYQLVFKSDRPGNLNTWYISDVPPVITSWSLDSTLFSDLYIKDFCRGWFIDVKISCDEYLSVDGGIYFKAVVSESRHLWGLSVSSQLSAAEKTGGGGITDVQMGRLPGRLKSSIGWPGNLHNFLEFLRKCR